MKKIMEDMELDLKKKQVQRKKEIRTLFSAPCVVGFDTTQESQHKLFGDRIGLAGMVPTETRKIAKKVA